MLLNFVRTVYGDASTPAFSETWIFVNNLFRWTIRCIWRPSWDVCKATNKSRYGFGLSKHAVDVRTFTERYHKKNKWCWHSFQTIKIKCIHTSKSRLPVKIVTKKGLTPSSQENKRFVLSDIHGNFKEEKAPMDDECRKIRRPESQISYKLHMIADRIGLHSVPLPYLIKTMINFLDEIGYHQLCNGNSL